ncbi:MAG: dihydrodipicolinate synthase family protein, partial [Aristaeellaceae bacterium]
GGIGGTYAAMPELFLKMDELVRAGKFVQAQPIQHEVNNIIADLCACHGSMYAVIKKVLEINEGLALGGVHRPMPSLIPEDMPKVEAVAARIRAAIAKFC